MTPDFARRTYREIVEHMLAALSREGVLTDTAPGSVTRTLVEATAREFAEVHARMSAVYEAGFLDTATGAALDQLVALLGLTRLPGETEIAELRLGRDSRVSARVIIPAGTVVTIDRHAGGRVSYAVLDEDELRVGEASLVLTLRALPDPQDPQADRSITADDVALGNAALVQPIAGIAGLTLEGPSLRLGTAESDDALRKRARMAIAAAGGGTEKALEQALMEVEGVEGVRLRDAGDPVEGSAAVLGPGELEVILDGKPQLLEQNRARIEAAIARAKGPGIVARLARTQAVTLSGTLVIRPAGAALSAADARALAQACEALLTQSVAALEIGEGLQWNRLLAKLMNIPDLGDVLIGASRFVTTLGAVRREAPPGDLAVEKTQRLVPGTGAERLEVLFEDRPLLRVSVQVVADVERPGDALADQFEAEVTALLIAYLGSVETDRPDATLTHAGLLGALGGSGGVATFPGQITAASVSFTVLDTAEGAAPVLRADGPTTLTLGQNAVLRSDTPAVRIAWKEPAE